MVLILHFYDFIVCHEKGILYPHNDIDDSPYNLRETKEDERLVECQHLCQEISGCGFFSFHTPTAMCSLKSGKSREHPQQSYISGKKYCGIFILLHTDF